MAKTATPPTTEEVREWARSTNWTDSRGQGIADSGRGRLPSELVESYNKTHRKRPYAPMSRGTEVATRPSSTKQMRRPAAPVIVSEPVRVSGERPAIQSQDDEAGRLVSGVIDALSAAKAARKGTDGDPVLVTMTAQTLVYA